MLYIEAQDRNQMMMCSLDSMVDPESIARVIDKFVAGLPPGQEENEPEAVYIGVSFREYKEVDGCRILSAAREA